MGSDFAGLQIQALIFQHLCANVTFKFDDAYVVNYKRE
jgi:hypothetical protein